MVLKKKKNYSTTNSEFAEIDKNNNEIKLRRINQNGQIQIYQSPHRGSYSSVIRDSIRNAALGKSTSNPAYERRC